MDSNLVIKKLTKTLLLFIFIGIVGFCLVFLYNFTLKTPNTKETEEIKKKEKKTIETLEQTPANSDTKETTPEEVPPTPEEATPANVEKEPIVSTEVTTIVEESTDFQQNQETYKDNNDDSTSSIASIDIAIIDDTITEMEEIPVEEVHTEEIAPAKETPKKETTSSTSNKEIKKNGWVKEGQYTYYYKNGKKLKDTYVDLVYLNKDGKKTAKVGSFTATLYGARAWTNQELNIRKKANKDSQLLGSVQSGKKVTILSVDHATTKYIKIKYGNQIGYVYSDYLLINLPDVMPNLYYEITNADKAIYTSASFSINDITGKNLYGFTAKYNSKIGKESYYAPLLYPVAKQLQKAYTIAKKENYNLKIYDSYRPYHVTTKIYTNFSSLYNNNKTVKQKVNYDKNGNYWGPSWFLAKTYSSHNRGIALDLALTNNKGTELKAQSSIHTLDTSSIVNNNNSYSNKLKEIMTKAGFETLGSEWWHFEEKDYKASPVNNFSLK